ncbi:MAG TPA: SIMPL domain-containing protein [Caulobacteraceae bacterium]|nr:SIMPL domain-containing protein [Caulobacteraceae bacterium]
MKATMLTSVALASLAMASAALAQAAPGAGSMFQATTLAVSADGQSKITPDQATITLGVQVTDATAQEAMQDDAQRTTSVMAALRAAGLPDKDVQTSNISLQAQYTYIQNQPPKLTGYQASNDVTVTVEDLTKLGPVIDAVTASGANQVNGINFGLKDPTAAEDQARLAAVKALQAKAALYAQATGYHIVRLVNLTEGAPEQSSPIRPMVMAAVRAQAAPTPVSAGELTVEITVTAVYELAR